MPPAEKLCHLDCSIARFVATPRFYSSHFPAALDILTSSLMAVRSHGYESSEVMISLAQGSAAPFVGYIENFAKIGAESQLAVPWTPNSD